MDPDDEDADLMARFQAGYERSFVELVDKHKQRVFNITYRYLGNTHDAEEAAQQVFINIYRSKSSYRPEAKFTTWLYTICKNTCLKAFRKKKLQTVSLDAEQEDGGAPYSDRVADANTRTPLQDTLAAERDALVKEAIDALPEGQRMAIILYKYEGLSYEETARAMGLSAEAVKSLLHRARVTLKEKLANYFKK